MEAAIDGDADNAAASLTEHYHRSLETVLGKAVLLCGGYLRFRTEDSGGA